MKQQITEHNYIKMNHASNFTFLTGEWSFLFADARQVEKYAIIDPVSAAFYSRLTLERTVIWLYENDRDLIEPYQKKLAARIFEQSFQAIIPKSIFREIDYIRLEGNNAVHGKRVNTYISLASLKYLHRFLSWVVKIYSEEKPIIKPFEDAHIPKEGRAKKDIAALLQLQTDFDKQQKALEKEQEKLLAKDAEIEKLKERLAAVHIVKTKNKHIELPAAPFTEAETRRLFIDAMLREAAWDTTAPNVVEYQVIGIPKNINKSGKGAADYVLWGDDGLPLAVIEAKKTQKEAYQGQYQAEVYANCLEQMHGQRPIIFFTNGFETWLWDDQSATPRQVNGFYTKEELLLLIQRRTTRTDIRTMKPDDRITDRYYQKEAIQRVNEAFCTDDQGKLRAYKRAALIVMATGAGKTRTAASIVDILTKANWAKRVLFLADRTALVVQAKNNFKKLLPSLSAIDLTKEKEDDTTRLVFSTYPSIMNRIDSMRTDQERFYGVGHFDLIIVDEAHRSVYQRYRAIFEYFDALLLGLTATPRDEADRDTYRLFECDEHNPTAYYELDQAVKDGYLKPPKGKPLELGFLTRGIKYVDLSESEQEEYESTFRDETGELPNEIDPYAINQWLFNANTIDQVLHHLMTHGLKVESGDKLGKTIVFARNRKHAYEIKARFDKQYPQYAGKFTSVIEHSTPFVQQVIDDFSLSHKYPQIAISVDMLDTGIDVPEILNLVFFKPVYSSSKYWQMIGRGTRLCPDVFGFGQDKEHFYIFDCCDNFAFFKHNPEGIKTKVPERLSSRIYKAKIQLARTIERKKVEEHFEYRTALIEHCHQEVVSLYDQRSSFRVNKALEYIDAYRHHHRWNDLKHHDITNIFEHIAPLIDYKDDNEQAKQYDLLLLQLQNQLLEDAPEQQASIKRIMLLSESLKKLDNIPAVQKHIQTINASLNPKYWEGVGIQDLEKMRVDLRDLIRIIPKNKVQVINTDFLDTLQVKEDESLIATFLNMDNYKRRIENYLRQHQHHIAIHKLRTNQPITSQELRELERLLFEEGNLGAKSDFEKETENTPLGIFIRSIFGLDRKAANEAFAEFLQEENLNANQMNFIQNLIRHLTTNGVIDKQKLLESPFTDDHYMGLNGVFKDTDALRIVHIINQVNENALVAG